jgi:hypothetical protein
MNIFAGGERGWRGAVYAPLPVRWPLWAGGLHMRPLTGAAASSGGRRGSGPSPGPGGDSDRVAAGHNPMIGPGAGLGLGACRGRGK